MATQFIAKQILKSFILIFSVYFLHDEDDIIFIIFVETSYIIYPKLIVPMELANTLSSSKISLIYSAKLIRRNPIQIG